MTNRRMMIREIRTFYLIALYFLFSSFNADNPTIASEAYIDQFKDLAIIEMHRSGVPASITLAQALVESQYGTSDLALQANNHFGIKCKSYWTGNTYYHKDDDRNKSGQLIESCFRSYQNVMDSYVDHSNFLRHQPWYEELFTYRRTDYKSWATGLKKCGYATDKRYAEKLIQKIERFSLFQYDNE